MLEYEKARKFPPRNNEAYRRATAAELLGKEAGVDPEVLYNTEIDLASQYGFLIKHPAEVRALVGGRRR